MCIDVLMVLVIAHISICSFILSGASWRCCYLIALPNSILPVDVAEMTEQSARFLSLRLYD